MKTVKFAKMAGAGNDFIIVRSGDLPAVSLPLLAKKMCDRKFGIGADGLLLLEKSRKADIRMRVINADGSEAQMCGNGARCVAFYANRQSSSRGRHIRIETAAGIILSQVEGDDIKVKLTEPVNLKLDIPVKVGSRTLRVNFVNTGVPHTVVFVQGIDEINVEGLGRYIRYHRRFFPSGTNVNFVEVSGKRSIKIRTYERGVEDETLACGTGAAASAIIFAAKAFRPGPAGYAVDVHTHGGETLKVYFDGIDGRFSDVWLEGKVRYVAEGVYYV